MFCFLLKVLWNHWVLWKENVEDKRLIIDFTVIKDMQDENVHRRGNYVSTYYWLLNQKRDIHRKIKRLSMRIKSSKLDIDVFPSSSVLLPTPSCEWYSWSTSKRNYWGETIIFITKPIYVWDSHLKYSFVLYIVLVGVQRQKFL